MAQLVPFIFSQWGDNNLNPLSGGKIYFYAAGTVTPQDTYTSAVGDTPNANPVVLDSAGRATIFLADLAYDAVLKDSLGNTIDSMPSIGGTGSGGLSSVLNYGDLRALAAGAYNYVEVAGYYTAGDGGGGIFYWSPNATGTDNNGTKILPSSAPSTGRWLRNYSGAVNAKWFGAAGDGSSNDNAAIAAAVTYINTFTNGGDLFFPKTSTNYFITGTLNFGAKVRCVFEKGAKLNSASTITVYGINAGDYQIFAGSGTVTLGVSPTISAFVNPYWFGYVGDGVTSDDAAWAKTIAAVPIITGDQKGATIIVPNGPSLLTSTLTISRSNILFQGSGVGSCFYIVHPANGSDGIVIGDNYVSQMQNIVMKDLSILCKVDPSATPASVCRNALVLERVDYSQFENVHVRGAYQYDVYMKGCINNQFNFIINQNIVYPYGSVAQGATNLGKVRIGPKVAGEATNANRFNLIIAGTNSYTPGTSAHFYQEGQSGEGDNSITGTIESAVAGRAVEVYDSSSFSIINAHFENSAAILYNGSRAMNIGPGVFCAGIDLVSCEGVNIDGVEVATTAITIDSASHLIKLGYISYNSSDLNNSSSSTCTLMGGLSTDNRKTAKGTTNIVDTKNLCWNGEFKRLEGGAPAGFNGAIGTVTITQTGIDPVDGSNLSDTRRNFGTNAIKLVTTGAGELPFELLVAGDQNSPSILGQWLTAEFWAYVPSSPSPGTLNLSLTGVNSGDTILQIGKQVGTNLSTDTWVRYSGSYFVKKSDNSDPLFTVVNVKWSASATFYIADMSVRVGFGSPHTSSTSPVLNGPFIGAGRNKISYRNAVPLVGSGNYALVGDLIVNNSNVDTAERAAAWLCTTEGNPGGWRTLGDLIYTFTYRYTAVAATAVVNITISNPGTLTYDGHVCAAGNRILLASQTDTTQNGIYIVGANSSAALVRATDMDAGSEVVDGSWVYSTAGATQGGYVQVINCVEPVTLGTTSIVVSDFIINSAALFPNNFYHGIVNTDTHNFPASGTGTVFGFNSIASFTAQDSWQIFKDQTSEAMYVRFGNVSGVFNAWIYFAGNQLTATAALDFGSIAANTSAELTIAVSGASAGDDVLVTPNGAPESGLSWSGYVSSSNVASVRLCNVTAGAIDPASRTWRATVTKH